MKKGTLISIEGADSTGKETQANLLREYYLNRGYKEFDNFLKISFPMYGKTSATMVEKYLHGELCNHPDEMDPFTASMFYTIDRSISYKNDKWGDIYRNGGLIVTDRYVTSNIIHQASKLDIVKNSNNIKEIAESKEFTDFKIWLSDLEYDRIKIPEPDLIIMLVNSDEAYQKMITNRGNNKDLHEKDIEYQNRCRKVIKALELTKLSKFEIMNLKHVYEYNIPSFYMQNLIYVNVSDEDNNIRSVEDIHKEILEVLFEFHLE